MISNIGKSNHRVNCLYSEGKVINSKKLKLVAKYVFSQASSNLKNRLAGSGGDCRTGEGEGGRIGIGVGQRGHGKAVRGAPKEG